MRFVIVALACLAVGAVDPDQEYINKFLEQYPKVDPVPQLEEYATAARYDALYLGESLDAAREKLSNDTGGLAWGFSYRMMSLNDMYRATGDVKYLEANLKCIRAALAVTDDKIGKKLWTGTVVPAWGSDKYADRGRAVFAVHTGIITVPMFEFLILAKKDAAFLEALGDEFERIRAQATAALDVHDRQWRDGPGVGEGHYVGLDQEEVCENKPLPGNRLSAMGWALWRSWQVAGNATHRDRALAIGRYIKHRLTLAPDGAYYWPYWLPIEPVTERKPREAISGEDSSHAGLTAALPFALAADGEVFTEEDMVRFAKTVTQGIARLGNGILLSRITGATDLKPGYTGYATNWLPTAKYDPGVREAIMPFYLNYVKAPGPKVLAQLLRFVKETRGENK